MVLCPETKPVNKKERISWDVRGLNGLHFMGFSLFWGIRGLLPHFSRGCSPVFFKSSVHGLDAAKACQFGNFPDA